MAEWKRILTNPRRAALLILLPVLCVLLYLTGRMDNIQLSSWQTMVDRSHYRAELTQRCKGMPPEEALQMLQEEKSMLSDVSLWTLGWRLEGTTEEEIRERLAGYPAAAALVSDKEALRAELSGYQKIYTELLEQFQYLEDYPEYLKKIQEQARQQSQTTIFGDHNSFSYRNLQQTAKEFAALQSVNVEFGSNQAVESWIQYDLADYLFVIVLIVIVLAFLEERKKGLWSTVRSCRYGRLRLGVVRAGILLVFAVLYTILFYGINLLIGLGLDGGWGDLGRPLQSLVSFKTCSLQVTIGGWILQFLCIKAVSGFLMGLLLWCVLGWISNIQFSLTVLGGILLGEYILFAALPVQSILNPLKYFNLFSYVHTFDLYTQYLNIDLAGYPVGIRGLALWALPVLILVLLCLTLWIQKNRYPAGNRDWLGKLSDLWSRLIDVPRRHFSIGVTEVYKTLFLEWSILLLAALFLLSGNLSFYTHHSSSSGGSQWYPAYLKDAEGPIDEGMEDYLQLARQRIADNTGQSGDLTAALDRLEARVRELQDRAETGGYAPWLIDQDIYENIYGEWAKTLQRQNAALALIFVLLTCAGLIAYERQSNVIPMLKALKRGRRDVFLRKAVTGILMALLVWGMIYGREIAVFMKDFKPEVLAAPVQNLDFLKDFPWRISIAAYMGLTYGLRLLLLMLTAFAAIWISGIARSTEMAYMLNLGIIGIPALLFVLGIEACGWISPVVPVAATELLNGLSKGWTGILPWLICLTAGTTALALSRRKWIRS